MKNYAEGCTICGLELDYKQESVTDECYYCGKEFEANVRCPSGHFVCDNCHSSSAFDLIQKYCTKSDSISPMEMALILMHHPQVKMHGPEHHYLVPAVLLSAYFNFHKDEDSKKSAIRIARVRSEKVPGGFCGSHGNCGAAVGSGIFISIISGSTPLAEKEWQLSNSMTGRSLLAIANHGGPRCCKRDSFLSIQKSINFIQEHFNTELPTDTVVCDFSHRNKQCKLEGCLYYRHN